MALVGDDEVELLDGHARVVGNVLGAIVGDADFVAGRLFEIFGQFLTAAAGWSRW